ncbi:rCG49548 [Rattus norvegicus]|uniref:RCG49548 n=1 Tax=Rattus norvegicus TaxID=10116 RepID=A6J2F9_RAT|nr:rCG49548 [Rattus norvegicus]
MACLFPRALRLLSLLMVVLMVYGELHIESGGQHREDRTALQLTKRRYKREWVKFAKPCREREDNSKRNPIAKITSDFQKNQKITYRISGVGIDQPPFGIFVVDPNNGDINITAIVDREETPSFLITCRALNALGQDVERPLILTVKILDVNDNAPIFSQTIFKGEIEENSASNSLVMILNATDADEPNHMNSKIAFKIVSQEPAGMSMFLISRNTGEVRTLTSSLDREQVGSYHLIVSGADNDGTGLSTQCECSIKIKDVNDNFPVLTDSQYSARIEENTLNSELLRFQVTDWDEEYTDNWLAVYFFTSGNEGNWFEIETDPRTNEVAPLLLLTCDCGSGPIGGAGTGGFVPVPDGSEGTIHQWGIEGAQPEDKEITNICVPPVTSNGADFMESSEVCTNTYAGGTLVEGASGMEMTTKLGGATGSGAAVALGLGHSGTMRTRHSTGGTLKDYAAPVNMTFLGSYFSQKSSAYAEEEDDREVNDCLLIYDDEGEDAAPRSPALSSCSFMADDLDDSFLDSLGPKFKKLAEICLGVDDEAKQVKPGPKDSSSGADACARPTEALQAGSNR